MKNYALITTALSTLLLGVTMTSHVRAEDALADTLPPVAAQHPVAKTVKAAPIAATAPLPATPSATAPTFVPAPAPAPSVPVTSVTAMGAAVPTPVPAANPALNAANNAGALTTSPATPQAVQDAVTRLQKVDPINLDDVTRAQDAINRLDLLLEIEKRQSELKRIREERTKPSATSLLPPAIPSSVLNLPKMASPSPKDDSDTPSRSSSKKSSSSFDSEPTEKYVIKRISGADGNYMAVISGDDNSSQTVRVGDKLSDGSVVKAINLTSVSLFKDKKSKTLTIPTESYIVRESNSSIQ